MPDLCRRNVHQNQRISVLQLDTGAFLLIECCLDIVDIHIQHIGNLLTFLLRGTDHPHPHAVLQLLLLMYHLIIGHKIFHHSFCPISSLPVI